MTKLIITHFPDNLEAKISASYYLSEIGKIMIGKFKDFETKEDILANGFKPCDAAFCIFFKYGTRGTYSDRWDISYE